MQNFYNLKTIEEDTRKYIKRKFPNPVSEEDMEEFTEFLSSEYKLELAARLREIADQLEKIALK